MYPSARRVGSADPTNQSEDRSDVRSLVPRRQRLLGYMVLQPVASCQTGYPAAHTSSDEEDGHAQGPLMSVPMDPYGPRRKHLVTMSADAHLSHPLGVYVNAQGTHAAAASLRRRPPSDLRFEAVAWYRGRSIVPERIARRVRTAGLTGV